jgi:hypothetical protein
MRLAVTVVLLLALCPTGAGLGRELGSLKAIGQEGEPLPGAKQNSEQTSHAQKGEKKPLTNADVMSMVKAGLAESTIVLAIRHSSTVFDTSPQALISLKDQGVPQKVLDAMITAGSEKPTPPAGPAVRTPTNPASVGPVPGGPKEGSEGKGRKPDLQTVRKVYLQIEEWADEDNARAQNSRAIEKRTCLKVVDTSGAADAILSWSNQGITGTYLELLSKDGEVIWSKRGLAPPLGALKLAVGCPK